MLFWGAKVSQGAVVHRASIADVVPTLLTLVGVPIPATVDGQMLAPVIADEDLILQQHELAAAAREAAVSQDLAWQDQTVQSVLELPTGRVACLTKDCGAQVRIKAVGIEAEAGAQPVGPRLYTIEVSSDGQHYDTFASGMFAPVAGGQAVWVKTETPRSSRFFRLLALTSYGGDAACVRVGRLLVTSDGEI